MSHQSLAVLRKKQLLILNSFMIILLIIIAAILYVGFKLFYLNLATIFFLFINILFKTYPKYNLLHRLFPSLKEIEEHEEKVLGTQYIAEKKAAYVGQILVLIMIMFNTIIIPRDVVLAWPVSGITVLVIAVMAVALNIMQVLHARKVDKAGGPEQLEGYAKKNFALQMVVGISTGFVLLIIIITYLMLNTQW
jgi:hypothetical protein